MPLVEITAMTFGPYGVGRLNGKAVMVQNAVPGDVVEVAIRSERGGVAFARIDRIEKPGAARRVPPCPFLPRCGGCDWQQMNYSNQVEYKAAIVANEFAQALGVELDSERLVEAAPAEFEYRSRVRLKVGSKGAIGFYEAGSNRLVEIDRCLVADCSLESATKLGRAMSRDLLEIEVVGSKSSQVLVGYLKKPANDRQHSLIRRFLDAEPSVGGIVLRADGWRSIVGNAEIEVEVEQGTAIRLDADLFSQVNRAQNQKLVAHVMEVAEPGPDSAILDLFCGAGNFSIPAALRGAQVIGVDSDAAAIAAAAQNAKRMALAAVQFIAMDARDLAAFLRRAGFRPQVVVLDPPRTGAAELMQPIIELRPKNIVYVSCDVATLIRDLRALRSANYRIDRVHAFDFFPNTHHVEIVTRAVLT